jgi:hypothetical protein
VPRAARPSLGQAISVPPHGKPPTVGVESGSLK